MWQNKLLSHAGRLTLIKHVLASIPLHILAVSLLPSSTINISHRMMTKFFWGANDGTQRHAWISMDKIFRPTEEGGLGLRRLDDLQTAYSRRLW